MKLKLTKKSAMAEDTKSPTPGPVETQNQPVTNKLYKDDNGQRRMNTSMFEWQEVFSSTEKDTVDRARVEFGRKLISSFVVFDFDSSEFVLMTTETFYSESRRMILELGHKPWGVGDAEASD